MCNGYPKIEVNTTVRLSNQVNHNLIGDKSNDRKPAGGGNRFFFPFYPLSEQRYAQVADNTDTMHAMHRVGLKPGI